METSSSYRRNTLSNNGQGMAVISTGLPILAGIHEQLEECCRKEGPPGLKHLFWFKVSIIKIILIRLMLGSILQTVERTKM